MSLLGLLFLTGCADNPNHGTFAIINNDTGARNADVKLAEAADSVSQSLRQLAEVERASHPQAKLPSPPDAEAIGMNQLASIEWTGPVGPLVDKIALATHYKVRALGRMPAIPILVSISAKDTQLADILRDASFQCGEKASIVVYPASKVIELRYKRV